MMQEVTADHAQRLTMISRLLENINGRLGQAEAKIQEVEPKVNTIESDLARAAHEIRENDTVMKGIVEANDQVVKAELQNNDREIKGKMEEMNRIIQEIKTQSSPLDPSRGGQGGAGQASPGQEVADLAARSKIEEINVAMKAFDQDMKGSYEEL